VIVVPWLVVAVAAANSYYASRPAVAGRPTTWLFFMLPELPLALLACLALMRSGRLAQRLLPRRGDIFLGVLTALVLIIACWSGRYLVMPLGSPREAWLAHMYVQLGDPTQLQTSWWLPLVLIIGSMLDEMVWRGWIQDWLSLKLGGGRGLALTAGLYSLTAIPAMFTLADPTVGTNVLLPLLAMAGALVWGYATLLSGRATPAMVSHAAFVYFSVMQFRPGL
jgi:membrane protease YdiL (CAAX protease family)